MLDMDNYAGIPEKVRVGLRVFPKTKELFERALERTVGRKWRPNKVYIRLEDCGENHATLRMTLTKDGQAIYRWSEPVTLCKHDTMELETKVDINVTFE